MLIYLSMLNNDEDKSKFEQLYMQYRRLMLKVSMGILNDHTAAEDAVHDAFLKVLNNLHKIDTSDRHKTKNLMVIIIRGCSINLYRKRQLVHSRMDDNADLDEVAEMKSALPEATVDRIVEVMESIGTEYADIIMLKYYYDFSGKEIAKMLGISHEAVRARIARARKKIRESLQPT